MTLWVWIGFRLDVIATGKRRLKAAVELKEVSMKRFSQPTVCSRRQFLSGCAACAGCISGGTLLGGRAAWAEPAPVGKPKIRLVFCETSNAKPIWPNIGYDFDSRRNRLIEMLRQGCPDLEFLPARVMDRPSDADEVLKGHGEVNGYVVCVEGLGWQNDIFKLCTTGKPTLLVDNLFGGSGLFLAQQSRIMRDGKPIDWVSSSRDADLVASARQFASLKEGRSGAEVVAAMRMTRRKSTPAVTDWTCKEDPVPPSGGNGSFGRTPYFRCLARPWGQPPKVTSISTAWMNRARRLPCLAFVQIGHFFSQKS
jgi:hypothetical protein